MSFTSHTNFARVLEEPLIVCLAPTGMVPTKSMTDAVPVSPSEIIEDVLQASEMGITMAHLHARDDAEGPTYRMEVYAEIVAGIRKYAPDLVICTSCSGRRHNEFAQRSEVLELDGDAKPDLASLTLSSLNFPRQASLNQPDMVKGLAAKMLERGIIPELEIFDLGMASYMNYLIAKEVLRPPFYANILVGNIASAQADLLALSSILSALPANVTWSLGGIGQAQIPAAVIAAGSAHGVRIGLEDNIYLDKGRTRLASNRDLVQRVHDIADAAGRPIKTPAAFRAELGIGSD